jgi:hypothetical protein
VKFGTVGLGVLYYIGWYTQFSSIITHDVLSGFFCCSSFSKNTFIFHLFQYLRVHWSNGKHFLFLYGLDKALFLVFSQFTFTDWFSHSSQILIVAATWRIHSFSQYCHTQECATLAPGKVTIHVRIHYIYFKNDTVLLGGTHYALAFITMTQ